jgi:hypothetical protein
MTARLRTFDRLTVVLTDGRWRCARDPALAKALNALCPSPGVAPDPHGARIDWAIRAFGLTLVDTDTALSLDEQTADDGVVY